MSINIAEIRELLLAIAQTNITEVNLKTDDFDLTVKKEMRLTTTPMAVSSEAILPVSPPPVSKPPESTEITTPPPINQKWVAITAPMVGTFYLAPAPGESAYVNPNDRIQVGQAVCIVEAMKLMNEIESEIAGQIMEIVAENGEPVEYGQTLMWVKPDA